MSNKSGQSATTAKSLNAIQGRFMMQSNNGEGGLGKYGNGGATNAYAEDAGQNAAAGAMHGNGNATMAQQVRVSSKDGARKKKS